MLKRTIFLWMSLALLLASCQANAPATLEPTKAPQATNTLPPMAPVNTVPAQSSPTAATTPVATTVPGCTVVSPEPTPGPTQQSLFPAVKDTDWAQGPSTASVTIIEYSDFQ